MSLSQNGFAIRMAFPAPVGTVQGSLAVLEVAWVTPCLASVSSDGCVSPRYELCGQQWRMVLFPKGYKSTGYVSILVMACQVSEERNVEFTIRTLEGKRTVEQTFRRVFSKESPNGGALTFIPLSELDEYTVDGCLKVQLVLRNDVGRESSVAPRTGFVGLRNQRTTSYLNSILQVLFHIPIVRRLVFSMRFEPESVSLELQHLFGLLQCASMTPSSDNLAEMLGWDTSDRDLLSCIDTLIGGLGDDTIAALFRGTLTEHVHGEMEETTSHEIHHLSLTADMKSSLEEVLLGMVQQEPDKGNGCGFGRVKWSKFSVLPKILQIQLTGHNKDMGSYLWKRAFHVPIDLDMAPFYDGSEDVCKRYELFALIAHRGKDIDQHYVCFCRPTADRRWVMFDDSHVERVPESVAINPHSYHVCFVSYIRKDAIAEVMSQVQQSEVPQEIYDYHQQWFKDSQAHPGCVSIEIYTPSDYLGGQGVARVAAPKKVTVSEKLPIREVSAELCKRLKMESCCIWEVDKLGLPLRKMNPEATLGNRSRVFVTDGNVQGESPLFIAFFDPNEEISLRIVGFAVLDHAQNLEHVERQLRSLVTIPDDQTLSAYLYNGSVRLLDVTRCVGHAHGILVFQIRNQPFRRGFNRSIDLVPELASQRTVDQYIRFIESAVSLTVVSIHDKSTFELQIAMNSPLSYLVESVRAMIKMRKEDAVILFQQDGTHPIMLSKKATIADSLKERRVFYQVLEGVTQEDVMDQVHFHFDLFMCGHMSEMAVLLPNSFRVSDLYKKLQELSLIESTENIRVLQIRGREIVGIMASDAVLDTSTQLRYRVETIPEEQWGINANELIRVTVSRSGHPHMQSSINPFLFRIMEGEVFRETRQRLIQAANVSPRSTFSLVTHPLEDAFEVQDGAILSRMIDGSNPVLYIFETAEKP